MKIESLRVRPHFASMFVAFMAISLVSLSSYAGFYVEPYVGYQVGTYEGSVDMTSPIAINISFEEDTKGTAYGAKLGWSFGMFTVGADYSAGKIVGEDSVGDTTDYDIAEVGPFFQFNFGGGFKLGATYIADAKMSMDNDVDLSGSGLKIGVGYRFFRFLSVNLDSISISQDEAGGGGYTFANMDADRTATMLSLGFPFSF